MASLNVRENIREQHYWANVRFIKSKRRTKKYARPCLRDKDSSGFCKPFKKNA